MLVGVGQALACTHFSVNKLKSVLLVLPPISIYDKPNQMPKITKITFPNSEGQQLAARLELPLDQHPHNFVLFAHCFTCSKNLGAVRAISDALTQKGLGVLRFDFTGLGDSEGDFADTNFSSNVNDLIAAAEYLEKNYQAPSLLIGHSLGGAAVLYAAQQLESVRAIATVGAPAEPQHVNHLLQSGITEIEKTGQATVSIGGRPFTIKKQFLDDLQTKQLKNIIPNLKKALLILHSPQDRTVSIDNAQQLYLAAKHPKSFITLDGADHLLSNKKDALYTGHMIASWSERYLEKTIATPLKSNNQVAVRLNDVDQYTTEVKAGKHLLLADEPESVGGNDFGPSPYEYVSSGLGACTVMTLHMYARRKKWPLEEVTVHIDHGKRYPSEIEEDNPKNKLDHFDRYIEIKGDLDEAQRNRLLEIADRCPVHRTLHNEVIITTKLID